MFTPYAFLKNFGTGGVQTNTPIRYFGTIPPTVEKPGYAGKTASVPAGIGDALAALKPQIGGNVISPLIAARTWTLFRALQVVQADHGAPLPAMVGSGLKGKNRCGQHSPYKYVHPIFILQPINNTAAGINKAGNPSICTTYHK